MIRSSFIAVFYQETMSKNGTAADIRKIKTLDPEIQDLIRRSVEIRLNAYTPYSNFKVGAAVLCEDGSVYTGCNVENRSFTVGLCAERCAYVKAISDGKMKFKAVAVVAQQEKYFTTPCGACRQFMSEFGGVDVYMTKPGINEVQVATLNQLLPYQFEVTDFKFT